MEGKVQKCAGSWRAEEIFYYIEEGQELVLILLTMMPCHHTDMASIADCAGEVFVHSQNKYCHWIGFTVFINHCEWLLLAFYSIHLLYMKEKIC